MIVEPEVTPARFDPEPERFRQALGHFCTGVTVITTYEQDEPAGFACQSFAALSLDPPLVLFSPSRASATWPRIARAGHFCVNVLSARQRALARVFGATGGATGGAGRGVARGAAKFDGVDWTSSSAGDPVLGGVLAWAGCTVEAVHDGGDHYVVIGRVTELGDCAGGQPLLFYRGRYAQTAPHSDDGPPEVVDTLLAWPRYADWM